MARAADTVDTLAAMCRNITELRGLEPAAVLVRRSTLEDVFLKLTGRTLVD